MSNKKTSQELNQYYFKSFILTRGSVSMLSLAFPGLFVGIIVFIPFYYEAKEFYNIKPWIVYMCYVYGAVLSVIYLKGIYL